MQMLKLVYIAHGWRLGLYGKPLINDEIQAWRYGPVIPRLYDAVRVYKSSPITKKIKAPKGDVLNRNENSIVEQVFEIYGNLSGPALSRLTHAAGTPWDLSYEPEEFGVEIPNDIIEDHYERLAKYSKNPVHA